MRLMINKFVSKSVGIWTFLLLLIFKGILPQPAYALLSSLDACAVQPECAAAIGLELSPTIAAPTAEAAGTTAISTTTATGATTSSVEAVAGTTVVGDMRLPGVAAYYIWNKGQNQKAQEKAKERYCESHADIVACGGKGGPTGTAWFPNTITFTQQSDGSYYLYGKWITPNCTASPNYASGLGYFTNPYLLLVDFSPVPGCVGQVAIEGDPTQWKNWSQYLRNQAVNSLTSFDWQGLISSMPAGGILNPGDKIHAPTIVIPGQETDDPNTPADERLLRKESGFFTFPGIPDFDKDGIPDSIDLDNDNDGIVNTNDPEPYNPNVPFASSAPDQSGKVTPEVLQDIRDIINSYKPDENLKCVECADQIEAYLKEQSIHGRRVTLDTTRQVREDDFIMDDSLPASSDAISINGHHEGIAIRINGEEIVFDNHHHDGVPAQQWMNNLTFYSKEYSGASFRQSGYLF
ncbi:MAG: papain fold toxin domain-containing protein [Nostoc sp.]|uniref:papain fold toxin domain-containing protein n=1 Tax=Nostoc sp. TaxID=1180 RepID=UPI002FF98702